MAYVNILGKQIELKVVYYGMGLAGKTTNLKVLHEALAERHRGQMISLATETESTVFFDFFPLELGEVHGMHVRLRMYSVPGQDFYEASRRLVLEGADGIVFVVDSETAKLDENIEAFEDLKRNLNRCGLNIDLLPVIFQYNKRDLEEMLAVGTVEERVSFTPRHVFEAVAAEGVGVKETAQAIARSVIENFNY